MANNNAKIKFLSGQYAGSEIVRLQSHISSMTDVLESDESIGRKLDFMAQEMNREANTILSKSSDVDLADHAIELKTNVEKVREQIQNIE